MSGNIDAVYILSMEVGLLVLKWFILQDKNKKKVHKSSRKPGEESIVQIDPDEDLSDYSNEYRIKQNLLRNYDKTTRPVRNDTTPTTLYVGMSLFHILDTVSARPGLAGERPGPWPPQTLA